jgi:predicted PurR-regulated permease PerM
VRRPQSLVRYILLGLIIPLVALNVWVLWQFFLYFEQFLNLIITAAILAFLLNYLVVWVQRWGIRRNPAILLVLLLTLALLVLLGLVLVPIAVTQASQLLQGLPTWIEQGSANFTWLQQFIQDRKLPLNFDQIKNQINDQISPMLNLLPGLALGTLGRLVDATLIFILASYMLFYGKRMWQGLMNLLPAPWGEIVNRAAQLNFQRFFIAQLLLALFMFAASVPILLFFQTKFALLLALIVGAAQLVPVIGATVGIGIVVLIVALQNGVLALQVGTVAFILQQIKDNLLAPRLMGDIIGLNPLWQFIALLIGARIAGLLGAILSIPVAGTIKVTFEEFRRQQFVAQTSNPSDPSVAVDRVLPVPESD